MDNLVAEIQAWGIELGFDAVGISQTDLSDAETHLQDWLANHFHGEMEWMARHGPRRTRPTELVPGTLSIISARMNYLGDSDQQQLLDLLDQSERAYVSRYALGRDYHKLMRKRLARLAARIGETIGPFGYRVFTDSAPVMERAIAEKAGLGWIGKHTNLIDRHRGSWFFLGEIYTDLPLPADQPVSNHCGSCQKCIDICPTDAIVAPYQLDARRCISYLTIELDGAIPEQFRSAIGNRIYGCDDCQLICPWNRYAQITRENDFLPRNQLDSITLLELAGWSETEFNQRMEGSAIRRIGYHRWMRNIAVALGNCIGLDKATQARIMETLEGLTADNNWLISEHAAWALEKLQGKNRSD